VIRWLPLLAVAAAACSGGTGPVEIALGSDACASCRMTILSQSTAAQIVGAGRDPVLFDELGCLRDYLAAAPLADDARVYVADHASGAWVAAASAVFTRTGVQTPMGSGLLAHADAASRDRDPAARGGTPVDAAAVIGARQRSAP
jgi:copper chaperone NosL